MLTLGMACVSMVFWVRGQIVRDFIDSGRYLSGSYGIIVDSNHGSLSLMTRKGEALWMSLDGQYRTYRMVSDVNIDVNTIVKIPYWSIVLPLTLLSAYLLLGNSLKRRVAINRVEEVTQAKSP